MTQKRKRIIFYFILIVIFAWLVNETRYINRTNCLVPIEGEVQLRNDMYGAGYFNARRNGERKHNGVDLSAKVGTPVFAARSGWVINAKERKGMGKYVEINHLGKLVTIYGHLSEILVKKGQRVKQGDIIGKVGKTGNANYKRMLAHLHFEIRKDNVSQDPKEYSRELDFNEE